MVEERITYKQTGKRINKTPNYLNYFPRVMLSQNFSKRFGKMSLGKNGTKSFVDIFPQYLYQI